MQLNKKFAAAVIVAGLLAGYGINWWAVGRVPVIVVDVPIVNLGETPVDAACEASFRVENKGRKPLVISLNEVSCQCTVVEFDQVEISPGDWYEFKAVIHSPETESDFGADILLDTNDVKNPLVRLGIKGRAVSLLTVNPPSIWFGEIEEAELPLARKISIGRGALATDETLVGLSASSSNKAFDVAVEPGSRDSEAIEMSVVLMESTPLGSVRAEIVVKVEEPLRYQLAIPVIGNVKSPYRVEPASLFWGSVAVGQKIDKELRVMGLSDNSRINVQVDDHIRKFLIVRIEDGVGVDRKITATFVTGEESDVIVDGKLLIEIDGGGRVRYLAVHVSGVVR